MKRRQTDSGAPFKSINEAAQITGLSRDFIRRGVRAGTIPAIRTGNGSTAAYMIDTELFLAQLHRAAEQGVLA